MAAMDDELLPMPVAALTVDCADPPGLARWWQRLLGGEVEIDDEGIACLRTVEGHVIDFAYVPEKKSGEKNRLHLDLRSADLDAATEQVLALGATRADDIYDGDRWRTLRDPEGNEFCILRPIDDPAR
ncbi:VOC family protein [Actinoallomurus rhizosphaericola]|uniref:VOC family protein n=1 Tax=Actinoallomurus rhizosphaericola TaxID=2952536 RepID=UPI002092A0DB|nr:VOC family protein [Actinoallomurus rhizosphaericola]MCO5999848.1 VOC family protein [Actinoallomurus rhizosphaericola]